MNFILSIALSLSIMMLGIALFVLVRMFSARVISPSTLAPAEEVPLQHLRCRMERLLSPVDCELARSHGLSKQGLQRFRRQRRQIYRAYLRDLVGEFNTVYKTLQLLLVDSATDRPDVATELGRQRFTFYRALVLTEIQLILHACGRDQPLSLGLVEAVEALHGSLQQFAPAMAPC